MAAAGDGSAPAEEPSGGAPGADRFRRLSIEELMDIEVVSVSGKEQKVAESAAAVHVITGEDLRRSGVRTIPEALRMSPGFHVARSDSHTWAVNARGLNTGANKLLVLMDGRSTYSPLFSGVFWDVQDTLLEDIERIEVVRGPGGTLWGANAVNGVVNIITRHSKDSQGAYVKAGGGTEERAFGSFRYGGELAENVHFRVFQKYSAVDESGQHSASNDADDAWSAIRGGFRLDWEPSDADAVMFSGEIYDGTLSQINRATLPVAPFSSTAEGDVTVSGGFVLGRWNHRASEASDVQIQLYYDRTSREIPQLFQEVRDTFDVAVQHRFRPAAANEVVWGGGYRVTRDEIGNTFTLSFDPSSETEDVVSAFVQDEISLVPDVVRLTLGSKFEHNDHTGLEYQPGARLFWAPGQGHAAWLSASRSVRTPTRIDDDVRANTVVLPGAPQTTIAALGSRHFRAEELLSYEFGYRAQATRTLSVDAAVFYNRYENLRSIEPAAPFLDPGGLVVPLVIDNKLAGRTWGLEVEANWQVSPGWALRPSYTFLRVNLDADSDSGDAASEDADRDDPDQQAALRSSWSLGRQWELDAAARYVDSLPRADIPSYVAVDVRLGWHPREGVELSLVGQNVTDGGHREAARTPQSEIQRGVYGALTLRF